MFPTQFITLRQHYVNWSMAIYNAYMLGVFYKGFNTQLSSQTVWSIDFTKFKGNNMDLVLLHFTSFLSLIVLLSFARASKGVYKLFFNLNTFI